MAEPMIALVPQAANRQATLPPPPVPQPFTPKARGLSITETNPVRAANAVQSIPVAVLTFLVAFGIWSPSDIQWAAILGLYTALSVKVSELARGKVWSPASVAQALADKG